MDPYAKLKEASSWMWALGDYRELARFLEPHAEALAKAAAVQPGMDVLDVAAGNGNFAIAAAKSGANVTATDLTPKMIEIGRSRTEAANLVVEWLQADAEALPFADDHFDLVASVFGAMFAPRPDRVAAELIRVVRPGGIVAMANYSSRGYLGSCSDLLRRFSQPPPGGLDLPSPFAWGDPQEVRRRFNGLASTIQTDRGTVTFTFPSPEDGIAFWERTNPPMLALKTILPVARYQEVRDEAAGLMRRLNRAGDGRMVLDSDYLSVVARKSPR